MYALDAAIGKELWSSGRAITSTVRGGITAGAGNVDVPGSDSTLYCQGKGHILPCAFCLDRAGIFQRLVARFCVRSPDTRRRLMPVQWR
jgi:hypothetical protein